MRDLVVGIDAGTSGVRAVAMDAAGAVVAEAGSPMSAHGDDPRSPDAWAAAMDAALDAVFRAVDPSRVAALAVDSTSGTVLPVDAAGRPLARPMMYNDAVADRACVERISALAPAESAAHGPTSGLAKAVGFASLPGLARVVHQADHLAARLSGRIGVSDANNALKTGFDPLSMRWPDWIAAAGIDPALLPDVVAPGTPWGRVTPAAAARHGLDARAVVVAGTTDGCASFLATGAEGPGAAVTALGTSLTIKILSDRPVFAPQYGIYSHRIGDVWLAGGASNTGGRVLLDHFPADRLAELSAAIDPETDSGLDYYPLSVPGERFPIRDPDLAPRLEPRPADDALFLKGMLEGVAAVEALAYRRLAELGAPSPVSVRTVGGGARNAAWTRLRERRLGVPFLPASSTEAAAGTARLALAGARAAGEIA